MAEKAIREPASTAAFQAGAGENQASTGLGAIGRRTACASLTSKPRWPLTKSGPDEGSRCHMSPRLRCALGATEVQSSREESEISSTRKINEHTFLIRTLRPIRRADKRAGRRLRDRRRSSAASSRRELHRRAATAYMPTTRYWLGRAAGALEAVEQAGDSKVRDCRARYGAPMLQGIKAGAEIRRSVPEAARTREPPCPCPPRIPSSWSSRRPPHHPVAPPGAVAAGHPAPGDRLCPALGAAGLTLISFFTVLFTEQMPRPLFNAIVMTYRYEWRAMSYAFFSDQDYPHRHPLV